MITLLIHRFSTFIIFILSNSLTHELSSIIPSRLIYVFFVFSFMSSERADVSGSFYWSPPRIASKLFLGPLLRVPDPLFPDLLCISTQTNLTPSPGSIRFPRDFGSPTLNSRITAILLVAHPPACFSTSTCPHGRFSLLASQPHTVSNT